MDSPRSILVVKPSSFGDVVHTLPAVARLKRAWPGARLTWVINPEWMPLLDGNPDVQAIMPFPRAQFRGWGGSIRFLHWCREVISTTKPDLTVDFQGLLRSAWIGRASGARNFVGMSHAREGARWFYRQVVQVPTGAVHAVDRYLAVADAVLQGEVSQHSISDGGKIDFKLPTGESLDAAGALPRNYLLLHPYARGAGKSLTWEQIQTFCQQVAPRPVLLVGRSGENQPGALPENVVSLLDQTTLLQLIWLIWRARAVVTVDSGPSHLAAALQRPMIAVHTWSDPRKVGPYFSEARVWKNGELLPMRQMVEQGDDFFRKPPTLPDEKAVAAIAAEAISLSDFSA